MMLRKFGLVLSIGASLLTTTSLSQTKPRDDIQVVSTKDLGKWRRAETDHFIFYSDGSEKSLREDAIKLERFDKLMRLLVGAPDDQGQVKLTVYFVSNPSAVQSLYPGGKKDVAGFYVPTPSGALAVTPRAADAYDGGSDKFPVFEDVILFHEYTHHLMRQYFPSSYPSWYVEGFAEYLGNSRVEANGIIKYGMPNISRAPTLFQGVQLKIETLLTANVGALNAEQRQALYARGWALTHYLNFESSRKGQLAKYLDAVGKGKASIDAAQESFGDLKQLNKALDKYVEGKIPYKLTGAPLPAPAPFAINQLSEGESEAVLLRLKLSRGTLPNEREQIAQNLRRLATKYPGSAAVLTSLSEAELDLRNETASGLAAEAALKIEPQNSRALLWKGLSIARPLARAKDYDAAKWKVARSWIVKANRANPDDAMPLYENFLSYVQAGVTPPDIAIKGLAMAVSLVPQEPSMRFSYATVLANQKRYDDAVTVLGPVANNPHGGGPADAARKFIDALKQAKVSGKASTFNHDMFKTADELQ